MEKFAVSKRWFFSLVPDLKYYQSPSSPPQIRLFLLFVVLVLGSCLPCDLRTCALNMATCSHPTRYANYSGTTPRIASVLTPLDDDNLALVAQIGVTGTRALTDRVTACIALWQQE